MKTKEIKLPKSVQDLRLYHIEAISDLDLNNIEVYDKCVLVHKLTGIEMETVKRISMTDINYIIDHYMRLIAEVKREEPPIKIEVDGKKYERIKSISKMPMSWHIDIQTVGTKDSATVSAFLYIEEGMDYCTMDKHDNIINPLTPRIEAFREHLSADLYIKIGFFLSEKLESFTIALEEINKQRSMLLKKKGEKERKKEERKSKKITS